WEAGCATGSRRRGSRCGPSGTGSRRMTLARQYDVVTFDCYGTLIDWEGGLATSIMRAAWADRVRLERGAVIRAYMAAEREVEAGPYRPYPEVLAGSARRLAARPRPAVA